MMTKVVLELSFNDDDSNKKTMRAPAKAKSKPVAIQKAKKVVKESVSEDDDGDDGDDSSFNLIMELNTESKKKTPSIPRKILPKKKMTAMTKTIRKKKTTAKKMEEHELSGDDDLFSDKQEELQANVKLPGKSLTKMSKDSVSGDDASVEGKPSRRSVAPSNLETLKKTRKSATKQVAWEDYDAYDIVLPSNLINISNGECTLLVQIDPDDAVTLDFTGAMGAVGRMEADDDRGKTKDYERFLFGKREKSNRVTPIHTPAFALFLDNLV